MDNTVLAGPLLDYLWGTQYIFLHELSLKSSFTIKSNHYGTSTRLGTRNRSIKSGDVIDYK